MGWVRAMFNFLTGRNNEIDAQQEVVSRALAYQRNKNERIREELTSKIQDLRGSEARMHDYFARLQLKASRGQQGEAK